jgi:hypothetical protein
LLVSVKEKREKEGGKLLANCGGKKKLTCPAAGICKPKAHKLARTSAAMGVLAGIPGVRWAVVGGAESAPLLFGWKGVAGSSKVKGFK